MQTDVAEVVDRSVLGPLQWRIFALCACVLLLDGYDLAALGFVVPTMAAQWAIPVSSFGLALSSSLMGAACGSTLAGWLGDRFGRRRTLLAMILIGALASLLTAFCESPTQLIVCRFVTGVGMAGTIPNALALVSEYAPRLRRTFFVVMVVSCAALGSTIGSLASQVLIPNFGWQSVFVAGGVLPCLVAFVCWRWLPESLQWLVSRGRAPQEARRLAVALVPALAQDHRLQLTATLEQTTASHLGALFSGRLRAITPLLWGTFVLTQALVFFLASWLSSLITGAGHPLNVALRALAMLHFGGLLGGLLVSWLGGRRKPEVSLVCNYAAGVLALLVFSDAIHSAQWLPVLSFIAGMTVIGSAFCLSALATACYPSEMRATGLGTALGIGRAGSILSPIVGGIALAQGFPTATILATFSIVMAICAMAVGSIWILRRDVRQETATLAH